MKNPRRRPAKTTTTSKPNRYHPYKNKFEFELAAQLEAEGIPFTYEGGRIAYKPLKPSYYLPDFHQFPASHIIIEGKGWFRTSRERTRLIDVRASHPHLDIRFVFTDANKRISKGSKTTYAQWCDKHGFKWATKGRIPAEWYEELKGNG